MRVRFLGAAPQWGDGGEFHGWQVLAPWHHGTSRFRAPQTADEIAAVRIAQPMVVAHLLIHVADLVAFWRHGQASVLYPVLRGGQDHSARAVLADRNPMVCRGEFTSGVACSIRHRPPMAPKVVVQWTALRRRVLTSVRVSARGHVACFDPKVTA